MYGRKKSEWGGARDGAGRPKGRNLDSKAIRIPIELVPKVNSLVLEYKNSREYLEKTSKIDINVGDYVIISLFVWTEDRKTYDKFHIKRKIIKVAATYFEAEEGWRIRRSGQYKWILVTTINKGYRKFVLSKIKNMHRGDHSLNIELYQPKKHKNLVFEE